MASHASSSSGHALLFPFMSKGHTIPLLHLARLLLRRNTAVTIITTPANRPFIAHSLADTDASILVLPFPHNIKHIPAGVESTDHLPSISLFPPFSSATKLMQPQFEQALQSLPPVSFIISDGFLYWTLHSASKFRIPRFVFYGMSNYATSVSRNAAISGALFEPKSDDEPFALPAFPWIKLTRNDFDSTFKESNPKDPYFDFVMECTTATAQSQGLIVNSFYELEPIYFDHWNRECEPKALCVGPLCLAEPPLATREPQEIPGHVQWLDHKRVQGNSVVYVAFGSQAELSSAQFREIATGIEKSGVNFLWVVRKKELELGEGFEERMGGRGMIVREWVNQREILCHEAVRGFVSHCGWNSVVESVCAGVPILAWPLMAEQPLNARLVAEELKVGLRVETCDGSVRGFVKWEAVERGVRQLVEGEPGEAARKKAEELAEAARMAVAEGGSSWCSLDQLIQITSKERRSSSVNVDGSEIPCVG